MLDAQDPLASWIGRSEERSVVLSPWPAAALHGALDLDGAPPQIGDPLPPFWRWLYFHDPVRRSALGRDGHLARGRGIYPPITLPRRMWAGGRLQFDHAVHLGEGVTKVTQVAQIARKQGRSGPLVFLSLRHSLYRADGVRCEVEEQDIVYRHNPPSPNVVIAPSGPAARTDEDWKRGWTVDPTLLFRYSALSYNGHRIHYDLDYCRRVEGYPGLVVHGPLLATLMLELVKERGPDRAIREFSFRAHTPLFDTEAFEVCGKLSGEGAELWVRAAGEGGRLAMEGAVRFGG
jgi:3-methylfumaryl-CoA hydratase